MFKLPEIFSGLMGLPCCQARISVGNQLVLDFGSKIFYQEPSLKEFFHGEWAIISEMSSWRLIRGKIIIWGDGDGEGEEGNYDDVDLWSLLQSLVGQTIINLNQTNLYDIRLSFNSSDEVHFMAQSHEGYYLSVFAPENQFITFGPGGIWKQESSLSTFELSNEEKSYNSHSENCYKRWQKIINKVSEKFCYECAYFINLSRGYYFGDFGLCSNKLSPYDGKVVGQNSGCPAWNKVIS